MITADSTELRSEGRAVLRYTPTLESSPTADLAEPLVSVDEVVPVVLDELAGWHIATANEEFSSALLAAGCTPVRHGHLYSRDLVASPPEAGWLSPDLGPLVLSPIDRAAADFVKVSLAAYPPGHPDTETADPAVVERFVEVLLTGESVGPFMGVSAQVTDGADVVGVTIINRVSGMAPLGGPWVSEVCRVPDPRYAGLGAAMLRHVMAGLQALEETSLSLVVTESNPARNAYERLGFCHIESFRKVLIPA